MKAPSHFLSRACGLAVLTTLCLAPALAPVAHGRTQIELPAQCRRA